MRRTLTRALALVVALACALAAALLTGWSTAVADDGWGGVDCAQRPTLPECIVTVVTGDAPGTAGHTSTVVCRDFFGDPAPCHLSERGWNADDGCYYKPAPDGWADAFGHPIPPAAWYEGWCGSVADDFTALTRMRVFGQPPGQTLLVAEAVRRLQLPAPVIRLNPPPPAAQLVHVPTWLWLSTPAWSRRSATASVPGLSVTATATPVSVTWSTGDGSMVTCHGAGTPWSGGDPMAQSPDCGHTYTRHSGAGVFTVRATITWTVSWVGGGTSGTEPALTSTATADIRVAESPTVITGGA